MEFNQAAITPIVVFNTFIFIFFTIAFFYQIAYIVVVFMRGTVRFRSAKKQHSFAFMIAAHNEEAVIAQLIDSIKKQRYPQDLIDIFVVADACTDRTAEVARAAGATVFERQDLARRGKSWVLDYGFNRVLREYPDKHEGFFVFDADNLLSRDYVKVMNDAFDAGFLVLTSYRNSKNFDSSWISAANATWFLREAKYLNNARMLLGTTCAISGSGWLVSTRIVRGMGGWGFHFLTEDIQFATFCAANHIRIGLSLIHI